MFEKLAGALRRTVGVVHALVTEDQELTPMKTETLQDLLEAIDATRVVFLLGDLSGWEDPDKKLFEQCQAQVKTLRRELTIYRESLEAKNRELDAMGYVWCNGGCETGVHRYDGMGPKAITKAMVETAVRNTERLVAWYRNYQWRPKWSSLDVDMKTSFYEAWKRAAKAERELEQYRAGLQVKKPSEAILEEKASSGRSKEFCTR